MAAKHGSRGLILCFAPTRIESLAESCPGKDSYLAADYESSLGTLAVLTISRARPRLLLGPEVGNSSPPIRTKKLIAIDQDVEALRELKANVAAKGMQNCADIVGSSFEEVALRGDVVYFEFCMHEMDAPQKALSYCPDAATRRCCI